MTLTEVQQRITEKDGHLFFEAEDQIYSADISSPPSPVLWNELDIGVPLVGDFFTFSMAVVIHFNNMQDTSIVGREAFEVFHMRNGQSVKAERHFDDEDKPFWQCEGDSDEYASPEESFSGFLRKYQIEQ